MLSFFSCFQTFPLFSFSFWGWGLKYTNRRVNEVTRIIFATPKSPRKLSSNSPCGTQWVYKFPFPIHDTPMHTPHLLPGFTIYYLPVMHLLGFRSDTFCVISEYAQITYMYLKQTTMCTCVWACSLHAAPRLKSTRSIANLLFEYKNRCKNYFSNINSERKLNK